MIISPKIFQKYEKLFAAQSTRLGGFSKPPYESMNLGNNTHDDKETILKNKEIFLSQFGIGVSQIVKAKQSHSDNILIANKAGEYYEGYDALVTNKEELYLAVSTADCTPILMYDPDKKVSAAIHAGWKGTKDHIVYKTALKLREVYGSDAKDLLVYIGACIGECSFEVDADVAQYFDDPHCRYDSDKCKYFINLKGHNKAQLLHFGVPENNIEVSPYDTFVDSDLFYSHRRDKGVTGRMWSVIGMKANN